jgi:eukaryotic-like serine/threonine-protein kinase
MTSERLQKIEDLFETVANCDPDARTATLSQLCAGDEELQREVEKMLAEYSTRGYETAVGGSEAVTSRLRLKGPDQELIGTCLGPYRVAELIGAGGMGAVYRAERDELFKQQAAIKVVRRGMDSQFILQRFGQERRMLAGLEHPNIARMIDGGATKDGLPYFVMEYIDGGQSITRYCAEHRLSVHDRIKLFRQVCAAIQYAHQKLIVHRDIKPGNILVNQDGVPKLLDFGIAKLLDDSQTEEDSPITLTSMRLMTPDYASPEQVRGLPITTATDIYSLGAVLYELLTGLRPHKLKRYTPTEIERVVCEIEVARPSNALSEALGETGKRATGIPAKAKRQLAGDLDNIVLMAMRKEPERRYQSVDKLSDDLRRYLEGLPVVARGDSVVYRGKKFIQRHKVITFAGAIVVMSLLIGVITTGYQARRAERRFQQVRKLANTFLFDFHEKIRNVPGTIEARELMAKTSLEYLDSLAQEAGGDAALQLELAQAYLKVGDVQGDPFMPNLGQSAAAMQSYRKSLDLAEHLKGDNDATNAALRVAATAYGKLGMLLAEGGDKRGAQETLRQSEKVASDVAQRTGDFQDLALVENLESRIGQMLLDMGDVDSALRSFTRSLDWAKRGAAQSQSDEMLNTTAMIHGQLGETLGAYGDLPAAIDHYQQATVIVESLIAKHPNDIQLRRGLRASYSWIGSLLGNPNYVNQGDLLGAESYSRKALALAQELVAQDRKNVLVRGDLALTHARLGDVLYGAAPAQALEQYVQGLAVAEELLSVAPTEFRSKLRHAICQTKLGGQLCRMGRCREGVEKLTAARAAFEELAAKDTANMQLQADVHLNFYLLAESLLQSNDPKAALTMFQQSREVAEKAIAASPQDQNARLRFIQSCEGLGRCFAQLAADRTIAGDQQLQHRKAACEWRRKAHALWSEWSQRVTAGKFGANRREQAARSLAGCN